MVSRLRSWSAGNKKQPPLVPTEIPPPPPLPSLLSFGFDFERQPTPLPTPPPTRETSLEDSRIQNSNGVLVTENKVKSKAKEGTGISIKGFFRARSNSKSKKDSPATWQPEIIPPVPSKSVLPALPQSTPTPAPREKDALAAALPILQTKNLNNSRESDDVEGNAFATFAAEEDLASLIYLVHSAGDKFNSNEQTSYNFNSSPGTPHLSTSSEFSSPDGSTISVTPSPTPYYSFLSHFNGATSKERRPITPPPPIITRPATPDSDDEYGSDDNGPKTDSKSKSLWAKKENNGFGKAEMKVPGSRNSPTIRRRALGARGSRILELSQNRMSSKAIEAVLYPISNNHYPLSPNGISTPSLSKIIFRSKIIGKLRKGVTLLEELEIERGSQSRGGYRNSFDSDQSDWSTGSRGKIVPVEVGELEDQLKLALEPFNSTVTSTTFGQEETGFESSEVTTRDLNRPLQLPTTQNTQKWIKRPKFIENHLIVLPIQGDSYLLDLIRPTLKSAPLEFSPALHGLAGKFHFKIEPKTFREVVGSSDRPPREIPGSFGERRKTSKDLSAIKRRTGFMEGAKVVMPGPLLLQALAESKSARAEAGEEVESEEDELPLSTLRNRVSMAQPSPSALLLLAAQEKIRLESQAELFKSQQESQMLAAEISRLQTNELIRKERQERIDLDREELNYKLDSERKELELVNWQKRKLAEQQKRARIMEIPTLPSSPTPIELSREQERIIREQKRRSRAMGVSATDDGNSTIRGMTRSTSGMSRSDSVMDFQSAAPPISRSLSFNRPLSSLSIAPSYSPSYASPMAYSPVGYSPHSIPNSPLYPITPTYPNAAFLSPSQSYQNFYSQNEFANSAPNLSLYNRNSFSNPSILRPSAGGNTGRDYGDAGDSPSRRERTRTSPPMKSLPFENYSQEPLPQTYSNQTTTSNNRARRPISFAPSIVPSRSTSPENKRFSLAPSISRPNMKRSSTQLSLSRSTSSANLAHRNSSLNLQGIENSSPPRSIKRETSRGRLGGDKKESEKVISLAESLERARRNNLESARRSAGR